MTHMTNNLMDKMSQPLWVAQIQIFYHACEKITDEFSLLVRAPDQEQATR